MESEKVPMFKYIGVKEVSARQMSRGDYNTLRGWEMPSNESAEDEGYLVEYPDGYISWCPKKQFEEANRSIAGMTFGHAIEALKIGHKVARYGWNGKDMWLALSRGQKDLLAERFWNPHNARFAIDNGGKADVLDVITMKTADNKILMGWLASQTDMLAEDWCIVK